MKCLVQIILFSFLFLTNVKAQELVNPDVPGSIDILGTQPVNDKERIKSFVKYIERRLEDEKAKPQLIRESEISALARCQHCPPHMKLTESVNGILQKLKEDPKLSTVEEVPVSINRLNFLFYIEKARLIDGTVVCNRYLDEAKNFKPTSFPGSMELVMEDVFKFDGISQLQILDPSKEEITYYYRGEGVERNIIVHAILTKEGGKLRYYHYRPTEEELNPFKLPSMGEKEMRDVTKKEESIVLGPILKPSAEDLEAERLKQTASAGSSKDKASFSVDPKVIMRNEYLPKDLQLAQGTLSQELMSSGFTVNGLSELSLRGNKAQINIQDGSGTNFVILDVNTSLSGKTTRTVVVPYEMNMSSSKEGLAIKGQVADNNTHSTATFALTDSTGQYFRSEVRKDKQTGITVYGIAKDFLINKKEAISVAVGRNETHTNYASLQHKKALKDNITIVLDTRIDSNRVVTLSYQLRAHF